MNPRFRCKTDPYWLPRPPSSGAYRKWLIDSGSLTRRLQSRFRDFEVRGVRQAWKSPKSDEAALLGLRQGEAAWVREVWLQDGDRPLVFARSVLPRRSLRGAWRSLAQLGSRPLGAALFADAHVIRSPLAYRKLQRNHHMIGSTRLKQALWARRSVFRRDGRAILVTEVFLPGVLEA